MPKIAITGTVAEIQTERGGKPIARYVDGEQIPSVELRISQSLCREFVADKYGAGSQYYPASVSFAAANVPDWLTVGTDLTIVCDAVANCYTDKQGQKREFVNLIGRFAVEQVKLPSPGDRKS